MRDQWFYSGWIPPQPRSRSRVAIDAPCIVLLARGDVPPHGEGMALAAALSVAQFGGPPQPPGNRPTEPQKVRAGEKEIVLGTKWSMENLFRRWYQLADDCEPNHMRCPICLQEMARLSETGGAPSSTAPMGVRWTTVDHIIHIEHEECYWCVWPMCNECNSSKGTTPSERGS